jgi:hypothetical protein
MNELSRDTTSNRVVFAEGGCSVDVIKFLYITFDISTSIVNKIYIAILALWNVLLAKYDMAHWHHGYADQLYPSPRVDDSIIEAELAFSKLKVRKYMFKLQYIN